MKHHIKVTQVFKVTRIIKFEVDDLDDNNAASALERVEDGDADLPSFDDPRWKDRWDLQHEEAELADQDERA